MLRRFSLAIILAGALPAFSTAHAQPGQPPPQAYASGDEVDESVFYEPLASYGAWREIAPYGWVWAPHNVDVDWRPYQQGRWVWSDSGWTWVSTEPFGWATYHYGRWNYHPQYGWIWSPGSQWGPAWVEWRQGDGWVGWAPLPIDEHARPGVSINVGRLSINIGNVHRFGWCFVEESRLCEPSLGHYIARQPRNASIYDLTRDVTHYSVVNNVVFNRGIDIVQIERRIGRPVPRYVIREERGPITRTVISNNAISVYRPKFVDRRPTRTPVTIIQTKPHVIVRDSHRFDDDRRRLDSRMAAERAALEDRQRRELARKGADRRELERRHAAEQAALREQADRERKLVERAHERDTKGQTGATRSTNPKFRIPGMNQPPEPKTPTPPPPPKDRKPKTKR